MSTPELPKSEAQNPILGKFYASASFLIAIIGIAMAFLPWGYGFLTVFIVVPGVIFGGKAAMHGAKRAGRWASRANMLPIIFYVGYMVTYLPEGATHHTFQATILESGTLADQSVFDEKVQAAGAISGIRMAVSPCDHEFIIRVTSKPNSHLGLYVPTKPTRECLAKLQTGQVLDMMVTSTERSLTGEVKGYKVTQLGPCTIEEVDMGAIVKGTTCPSWF